MELLVTPSLLRRGAEHYAALALERQLPILSMHALLRYTGAALAPADRRGLRIDCVRGRHPDLRSRCRASAVDRRTAVARSQSLAQRHLRGA